MNTTLMYVTVLQQFDEKILSPIRASNTDLSMNIRFLRGKSTKLHEHEV